MKDKRQQKKNAIVQSNEYKCNICGDRHENNSICPIMNEKIKKYRSHKKKNFLYGNILLECMEKDVNFFDLIYEASYLTEIVTANSGLRSFNMEMAIDYFAMELDCSPKKFIRQPEKTIEELLDWGSMNYGSIYKDDKGQIEYILFNLELHLNWFDSKYVRSSEKIELYAVKEKGDKNKWVYRIYLSIPMIIMNGRNRTVHRYRFEQLGFLGGDIIIAEDYDGKLAKEFESNIDIYWEDMADNISSEDVRFDIWLQKLEEATKLNKLTWRKGKDKYITNYEKHAIRICLNQDNYGLLKNKKGPTHQFSVRVSRDRAFTFILGDDDLGKNRLFLLSELIKDSIQRMDNLVKQPTLEEKKIEFTDVLVVSSSMYCKTKEHNIVPYRGIMNILVGDIIEEYVIYVGYCKVCETYTVFKSDYNKMLKKGKPLCVVYNYEDVPIGKVHSEFAYKSQSVLASRGYNVQANSDLSESERQGILKDSLDKNLVQMHDLLDFLNWLVRTREPLPKYKNAISRWKKDIEFVEGYKKDERESVVIKSIIVK